MDRELIVQAVENAYAKNDLRFQVIWHKSRLHIYINRAADNILDYAALTETIEIAIANLRIYELEGFWLYSRVIGEVEPDWQTYVEINIFPTTIGEPRIAAVLSEHLEAMPSDSLTIATETLTNNDDVETEKLLVTALKEDEQLDSVIDSDVSNQLDASHELENSQLDSVIPSHFSNELDDSQNFFLEDTMKSLGLSSYCFIYNKSLLEGELLPPTLEIARIVRFFHNLPTVTKHQVLPIIDDYFRQAKSPDTKNFSVGVQQWFEQITRLQSDQVRKASIWLSRYCLNSEETMYEVQSVLDTEAARSHAANIQANLARQADTKDENVDDDKPIYLRILEQLQTLFHNKIVLPILWTSITALVILLGIYHANSSVFTSDKIPAICQKAIGSPNYCKLAVDLTGEKTFEKIVKTSPSDLAFTPDLEELAISRCERYANVKAGIPIEDADPKQHPVLSSSGERVFPNIFVTEAQQKNQESGEQNTVRVGCVYSNSTHEILPVSDIIPHNWPQESYQRTVAKAPAITFGFYHILILLGLNTWLSAMGIVVANMFGLGIRVASPPGIYLTAIALGVVVSLVSYLPIFNLVASIALQCLTLVLANSFIQGFKIQWQANIMTIAMGASVIVVATSLFYWLFIEFIYLFISS